MSKLSHGHSHIHCEYQHSLFSFYVVTVCDVFNRVYIHSAVSHWKQCLHSVQLPSAVVALRFAVFNNNNIIMIITTTIDELAQSFRGACS